MPESDRPGLRFAKMSGAGNDFILVNAGARGLPDAGALALALCARRTSVGADGLILVEPSDRADADVRLRFFNPDGRECGTCGNGTRCAARFAVLEGLAPAEMLIETQGSDIEARVSGENAVLHYRTEPTLHSDLTVTGADGATSGHLVNIGTPHLVIHANRLPEGSIEPICRPLRHAPELGEAGANVNLVEVRDRHHIRIRTFERGVEAETLACGSGSMSSAVALCAAGFLESPVEVEAWSGDALTVRFQRREDGNFFALELDGPARLIYYAEIPPAELEAILRSGSHPADLATRR